MDLFYDFTVGSGSGGPRKRPVFGRFSAKLGPGTPVDQRGLSMPNAPQISPVNRFGNRFVTLLGYSRTTDSTPKSGEPSTGEPRARGDLTWRPQRGIFGFVFVRRFARKSLRQSTLVGTGAKGLHRLCALRGQWAYLWGRSQGLVSELWITDGVFRART